MAQLAAQIQRSTPAAGNGNSDGSLVPLAVRKDKELVLAQVCNFIERLKRDDIKDHNICLVGVVGKFREGKSTLLNIMDRYLTQRQSGIVSPDPKDYVYVVPDTKDKFITSRKMDGCTQGIWITKDPYQIRNAAGEKFAVFLLDTQGLFDPKHNNSALDSSLFLLTSMFSSFTIFNTMRSLARDQFDMLAEFSNLAQKIRSHIYTEDACIFQDLIIMVRDTLLGDLEPGWESGAAYINDTLSTPDNEKIRTEIRKAFQNLLCFMMPKIAHDPDGKDFSMCPEKILPEFLINVDKFLSEIFGPKWLRPFEHKDTVYTCQTFAGFVQHITNLFAEGKIPKAEDIFQVMLRYDLQIAVDVAFRYYRTNMHAVTSKAVEPARLAELHELYKYNCKKLTQSEVAILAREPRLAQPHLQKLDESIDEIFVELSKSNNARLQEEQEYHRKLAQREKETDELREKNRIANQEQVKAMEQMAAEMEGIKQKSKAEQEALNKRNNDLQAIWAREKKEREEKERKNELAAKALKEEREKEKQAKQQHQAEVNKAFEDAQAAQEELNAAVDDMNKWKSRFTEDAGFGEILGKIFTAGIWDSRREERVNYFAAVERYNTISKKHAAKKEKLSELLKK